MEISRCKLSAWIPLAALGLLISAASPASADYLWDWSYKCGFETFSKCEGGSGTYTSTTVPEGPAGNPYYVLTGITGTVEGNTITSLLPPNSLGEDNDNKISAYDGTSGGGSPYSWDPKHTITGIAFLTNNDPATHANVNLLFQNFIDDFVGDYTQIGGPNGLALENVAFSAKFEGVSDPVGSTAPEPSSLILVTLGCLILGSAVRKLSTQR